MRDDLGKPYRTWVASKKTLNNSDLENYAALELTLMRNEVFALYGRKFDDPYLSKTFATRRWYKPNTKYSDTMLSKVEKTNAEFISNYQKRTGKL